VKCLLFLLVMKVARFFLRMIHLIMCSFGGFTLIKFHSITVAIIFSNLFEQRIHPNGFKS